MSPHVTALVTLLAAIVAGTLMGVLAKWALLTVDAFSFVWLQLAFAVPALAIYSFGICRDPWPRFSRTVWAQVIAVGLVNFLAVRWAMLLALERLPATTFGYLQSFVGLATMALSVVWLRERPSWLQGVGALLAVAGVRLFFFELPETTSWMGVGYTALVVAGLAVTNNWTRALLQSDAGLTSRSLTTIGLCAGGVPLVLAGVAFEGWPDVGGLVHWAVIAGNGVVGIAGVFLAFNAALQSLRSYEASVLAGSGILWMALFAFWILDERLVAQQWAGIAAMLVGQGLAQLRTEDGRS